MSATTEALTRKLGELHEELASLKCQVVEAVRIFNGSSANTASSMSIDEAMQFASKWSRQGGGPSEVQIRLQELESVLSDTVAQLQPETATQHDNQLQMSIATKARLQSQIQQSHEMLELLHVLSQLDSLFQHFDAQMDQHAFDVAAGDVSTMERLLHDMNVPSSSHVMDMMRIQARMRQNQLHCALDAQVDAVCAISPRKLEVFPAHSLWPSLQAANRLSFHLDALASSIHRHILLPLITDASLVPQIHANTLTLLSKPSSSAATADASPGASFSKVLQHVLSVFQFLHAHWPDQSLLGNVLWNAHVAAPLLALFVQTLPSSLADMAAFKTTVQPLMHGFDASMHTIGWTISTATFLDHLDTRYAAEKRQRVLVSVRQSMHKDYMDSVVVSTAPHVTAPPSSGKKKGALSSELPLTDDDHAAELRVSLCASKLWSQVESLLDEASQDDVPSQDVSLSLFHTARDAIFFFRMGLASLHKEALVHDPRVVMLVHNDCLFLTHHMLTCVYPRKASLPPGVSLIDMVPDVRDFGEHAVMHFAKTHSDKMLASLQTCPPWTDVHDDAAFNQAETCVKVVLFQLQRIAQHWKDGGLHVHATVLGRMIDPLLRHLVHSLLHPPGTSAPLVKAIHSVHHLFQLWVDAITDGSLFASPSATPKHLTSFTKFSLVTHLMEDSVVDVQDKWVSGALKDVGATDVSAFLKLVFPDSPQRARALATISQKK